MNNKLKTIKLSIKSFAIISFITSLLLTEVHATPNKRNSIKKKQKWTIEEILAERDLDSVDKKKPKYCQGGVFKPCVCPNSVSKLIQYRPSVRECKNNAAIILSGKYQSSFSAVVRDKENKDRWPPQGANGCSAFERDVLALNKCSVFKAQNLIAAENEFGDAIVHCLGASGYSTLFRRVSRITIKLVDVPNSTSDPLARLCLIAPDKPLN